MKIPVNKPRAKNLTQTIVASAWDRAGSAPALLPSTPEDVSPSLTMFRIPVLVPSEVYTGDNRIFEPGALSTREFPLPLLWQFKSSSGHDGSVIVGRIDGATVTDEGIYEAYGVFDTNPYAREVERLVRDKFIRGVSADLDNFSASEEKEPETIKLSDDNVKRLKNKKVVIDKARLSGATIVAIQAFEEVTIEIYDPYSDQATTESIIDGTYIDGELEDENMFSLTASAAPLNPPREWFRRPENVTAPTPISVDDNGRVFGYLALWKSNHIGYSKKQRPPRSASDYAYFRTGVVRTDDGTDVTVGNLTLVGGHASMQASAQEAVQHYDNTNSAVADVVAGEDKFGIWVAGVLRPTVTPEQVRAMRASAVSGDWRPVEGRLELVAACFVNVPGFMTTRAMVASGAITALVAAGSHDLEEMRKDQLALTNALTPTKSLDERAQEALAIFEGSDTQSSQSDLEERYLAALAVMDSGPAPEPTKEELDAKVAELSLIMDF